MARGRPRKDRDATQTGELVYCAADNIDRLTHLADGVAYPAVRLDFVADASLVLFPPTLISDFSMTCGPMLYPIKANKRESRTFAQTRDFLLPKLMSGEIHVREAEAVLAAVA